MDIVERSCKVCGIGLCDKTGYKRKGGSGYLPRCRVCHNYYVKDRYDSPKRGDLSCAEYDELMDECRGRCHLCSKPGDRALRYKGLYRIYCGWCAGAIEGGMPLLNKAIEYVGGGVESVTDPW